MVENERGDPQKSAPCGATADAKMSGAVTKVTGGSMLHLKVQETIYHPGHYRVALAVNSREELPPDPMTFERVTGRGRGRCGARFRARRSCRCSPTACSSTNQAGQPGQTYEADIPLPNINCAKCTLQVIQFMAEHAYNQPGGYTYHHCADLEITADPAKPIDKRWPAAAATTVAPQR